MCLLDMGQVGGKVHTSLRLVFHRFLEKGNGTLYTGDMDTREFSKSIVCTMKIHKLRPKP